MGILVLPEFAIRRMRHPSDGALPLLILALLTAATALRVGAAVATPHWLSTDRCRPMAVGGGLAEAALLVSLGPPDEPGPLGPGGAWGQSCSK